MSLPPFLERTWVRRSFGLLLALVGLGFLLFALGTTGPDVLVLLATADPVPIFVGVLLLVGQTLLAPPVWREFLGLAGERATYLESYRLLYLAALGKYVPGRVWALAGLAALAAGAGVSARAATLAATGTALVVALAGAVVGGLAFVAWQLALPVAAAGALVLLMIAALLLLSRLTAAQGPQSARARLPILARAGGLSALGWLFLAGSNWAIARSVHPVTPDDALPLVASAALAWAVALLAVVVPAGLGVREGIQALALTTVLPTSTAAAFVILVRFSLIIVDLLSAAAAWTIGLAAAGRTRAPLPPH